MNTNPSVKEILTKALTFLWDGQNDDLYARTLPPRTKFACHAVYYAAAELMGEEYWGSLENPTLKKIIDAIELRISPYSTMYSYLANVENRDPLTTQYIQEKRKEMLLYLMDSLEDNTI